MPDNSPFWLCYACGAQMRPLMDGDTPRYEEVNPDPLHELPHPPRRPGEATAPPPPSFGRPGEREWFQYGGGGAQDYNNPLPRPGERPVDTQPSFFGLLGELLGVGAARPGGAQAPDPRRPDDQQYEYRAYDNPPTQRDHANAPDTDPSSLRDHDQDHEHPRGSQPRPGNRQWRFNIGGGMATIHFGSLGGSAARDPWVGGYDGAPGDPSQGLDSCATDSAITANNRYFRGFGAGVAQPRRPPEGMDLLQALMALVAEEGGATAFLPANANVGDYVMTEDGFNDVLERLMQAAGPQGPIPAPDDVIRNLPHFTFTEVSLKESAFGDCAVCKEDFLVGDRAIKLPCEHVYHEDCLVPWLERNGSCPVCRKSLIPENPRPQASRQNSRQAQAGAGPSDGDAEGEREAGGQQQPATGGGMFANVAQTVVTGVLNRLFGQQGAPTSTDSQPASTRDEEPDVPGAFTETRRDDGPPDWYRNFFAPSPDAPQTPAERPDTDTAAPPPSVPTADRSGPSGLNIDTGNLHPSGSSESLRVPSPSRRPFGSQEVRRTPSNGFRQGPRTPTSASRPSTPGTYLYNPGEVGQRPSPLFATPFFQLPGQTPPNGAPVNTSPQDALAEALSESIAPEPNAGDAVPTAREYLAAPNPVPAPAPADTITNNHASGHPARDHNTAQTAPSPTDPAEPTEAVAAETTGLSSAPWSNLESTEWKDAAPHHRPPSPPPQLEQAAQAEQAEWGKQRPEDDPPEPLAEELNEYRQRQAERERRAKEEGT